MITIENLCKAYNDKILFKNFHLDVYKRQSWNRALQRLPSH